MVLGAWSSPTRCYGRAASPRRPVPAALASLASVRDSRLGGVPPGSAAGTEQGGSSLGLPCPAGPRAAGTAAAASSPGPGEGRRRRGGSPDGQTQARGAAFVLKPSEDSCVWSFAALFRKMSERKMTSERQAAGLPFDPGKAQVDPNNSLCRCPPRSSPRPGGELLSSPGLFIFSHSQSFASLPFFGFDITAVSL